MNEIETGKILSVIADVYPQYSKGRNPESTITLWRTLFSEESYQEVNAALLYYLSTDEKGFPPAPGKLKAIIADAKLPDSGTTETEAWAMVARATRNSIYNSREEFNRLPEEIQRVVGSPAMLREWAEMDTETFNSVVSSNFMRSYRARIGHVREAMKLPPAVKEVLGSAVSAMRMPDALEGNAPAALTSGRE
ncbi:MAG: replicative helicase loader/inhibitor [Aristaeellaceae bacterium]